VTTNHELAAYVCSVLEGDNLPLTPSVETRGILVLAVSMNVAQDVDCGPQMVALATDADGEVWEHHGHTLLVTWVANDMSPMVHKALGLMVKLHRLGAEHRAPMACGLAPGLAHILEDSGRPPEGWELEGPFYLARWMMSLSVRRGRPVLTRMAARMLPPEVGVASLGKLSVLGAKSVELYEIRPKTQASESKG
jgi:hypothetical protein